MYSVISKAKKFGMTDSNVLIVGETGTGNLSGALQGDVSATIPYVLSHLLTLFLEKRNAIKPVTVRAPGVSLRSYASISIF
mgnify:CR=1 FL=1